ncbi:MAG: adenylyltransferase/cytidyltransferase family protein [Endomicrobiales bacterium]|nr:adenylyltransferase/cytidyltransferase family protein [Endomicrobiales bacterium]
MGRNPKIISRKALKKIINNLKKKKKTVVFTNGCFDLLHIGHVRLFKKAKSYGDVLVVAINSDSSLKRLKGSGRPLVSQGKRAELLSSLESVDFVTFFDEQTPAEILKELKPDILVKGGDYKIGEIVGRDSVKKVFRFPVIKGNSTTGLIKKILSSYGSK